MNTANSSIIITKILFTFEYMFSICMSKLVSNIGIRIAMINENLSNLSYSSIRYLKIIEVVINMHQTKAETIA